MMNSYDYGYHTGSQRSLWYYLIFPLDAWKPSSGGDGFEEQKATEIWPIMVFLLPLIVLVAAFLVPMGFFGKLFFYGIEAFLVAFVCKFYAQLEYFGLVIELFLNFWLSFVVLSLGFSILFLFLGAFF